MLRHRAEETPDRVAYLFLSGEGAPDTHLTYGLLDRAARRLSHRLRRHRGTPVLICFPPGLDYLRAFFGCLYAGAVPVLGYPPEEQRRERTLPRLAAMAADSGAPVALMPSSRVATDGHLLTACPEAAGLTLLGIEEAWEGLGAREGEPWEDPGTGPDDLAFLMYTSGSTASPRGAMIPHRAALHNLATFPGFATRPVTAFVSWLPLFHDLGLMMGILHPLFRGVPGVMMAPLTFAQRPLRWIEAISRHRASTTGGPNFAYDLCVAKSTLAERQALDLRCWNLALNGSEPVRRDTLERFTEAFGVAGFDAGTFYPSYGLAEGAATVSGAVQLALPLYLSLRRDRLEAGEVCLETAAAEGERLVDLVGCGPGLADQEIAIADPATGRELEEGRIGEIWVRGPSVGAGYWRRPEETREGFGARLADGRGPFLRTGDLGFVHAGEVVITGRLKDLLIVHGANHHPEDVERTIGSCHPALRPGCGAAVGVETAGGERLVVIHEAVPTADRAAVETAVRAAVAEAHGLELHDLVLIEPGSILKTSSGKIRRGACRDLYLRGGLVPLAGPERTQRSPGSIPAPAGAVASPAGDPTAEQVESWLRSHLEAELGLDPDTIRADEPFVRFGLTSLGAVAMIGALEAWLGRTLSPGLAWQCPTLGELARHLGRRTPAAAPAEPAPSSRPAAPEPVAIVGMACRLPGAPGLAAFWDLLRRGGDAISEVPAERWNADAFFDPDPAAPGKMVTRWGGFLEGLDGLDAAFFGLSPREAVHLDPQQRLLLELCWEVLEDAGVPPRGLAGSLTGVFVSSLSNDYGTELFTRWTRRVEAYSGTGNADTMKANRLSYFLDLRGPSLAVDTACSGALVAVHLACESLVRGECELALAGGVNVILRPDANLFFSKAGALAPDGRCKPFDAGANGMVRSDGAGLLALKPLARAVADGDRIYAVIRGSAVNQDGRSNGLMAPNGRAQEEVLRAAYRRAGVAPAAVQYVEAHGTGTRLGDLVEANALGAVLADGRPDGAVCALGSVKSNIGHAEAAAGVASLIKTALALHHRRLPPSIHFERPTPLIDFPALKLAVQERFGDWPDPGAELVAGVSGFGIGGTNAHVVLAEAPPAASPSDPVPADGGRGELLVLSAATPAALRRLAAGWAEALATPDAPPLARACWSAARRRSHLAHRLAVRAVSAQDAGVALAGFAGGEAPAGVVAGHEASGRAPRVILAFSGQGTQWAGMGLRLLAQEPVFAAVVGRCDALFRSLAGFSPVEDLAAPEAEERLADTARAQAAIFSVQVGLAALWHAWGVRPHAVIGQSLGEVAAAWAAGALGLEDAAAVVHHRGRLMARVAGRGATALVALAPAEAEAWCGRAGGGAAVAGFSGPGATVVSGEPEAVRRLVAGVAASGVFARLLRGVDVAFHGPQMEPLATELAAGLAGIRPRPATVRLVSSVTAAAVAGVELDGAYWARNLRQPFRFAEALAPLIDEGCEVFLEVGPHPVLAAPVSAAIRAAGREGRVLASLRRDEDDRTSLLAGLGGLFAAGCALDWPAIYPEGWRHLSLPSYPWQRERFWLDQLGAPESASTATAGDGHPLLGRPVRVAAVPRCRVWERDLDAGSLHWLEDHRVHGAVVVPGAALLDAVAAGAAGPGDAVELAAVEFEAPLVLTPEAAVRVQVAIDAAGSRDARFSVHSRKPGERAAWTRHARGEVRASDPGETVPALDLEAIRRRCPRPLPAAEHYRRMRLAGLEYGPDFQAIERLRQGDGEALSEIRLPFVADRRASGDRLHPVLLDAAFQTVAAAVPAAGTGEEMATYLPTGLERLRLGLSAGERLWCHAAVRSGADHQVRVADLRIVDDDGRRVAEVEGLRLRRAVAGQTASREALLRLEWRRVAAAGAPVEPASAAGSWLIFSDRSGVGDALARRLCAGGDSCLLVRPGRDYRVAGDRGRIDPARPADLDRLVRERVAEAQRPCKGVVFLWPLDAPAFCALSERGIARAAAIGPGFLVLLVQALARAGWDRMMRMVADGGWHQLPRIWGVTRGAQATADGDSAEPAQAAVWGTARVVAREHPELWGGLVDLDPRQAEAGAGAPDEAARDLASALDSGWAVAGVAIRGGSALAPRLVPAAAGGVPPALRPDATYLVTGGLGDLGLAVAGWLAAHGARRLVLVGRRPLPARSAWSAADPESVEGRRIAAVLALEATGASVRLETFDVSRPQRLAAFLARERRERRPPVRGVVHAAGTLRDALLEQMTAEDFAAAWRPKAMGAWALHAGLRDESLDFFVLFSSIAPVLGSFAQANYAAGNAFLDAFAHARRAAGGPAVAIDWGPWSEIGMAARLGLAEVHRRGGIESLSPAAGLRLFERALGDTPAQVLALGADWSRWAKVQGPPAADLVAELLGESGGTAEGSGARSSAVDLRREVAAAPPRDRRAIVEAHLTEVVASVLRLRSADLDPGQPLSSLGLDSIMSAEVASRMTQSLGVRLALGEMLAGESLSGLAEEVVRELGRGERGAAESRLAGAADPAPVAEEARG